VTIWGFGQYAFPGSWKFVNRQRKVTQFSPPMPAVEGTFTAGFFLRETTLKVSGIVGGSGQVDSNGNPYVTLDDVAQEMNVLDAALCLGYGIFDGGFTDHRYIIAQKQKMTVTPQPAEGRTVCKVDLDLFAPDGRWLVPIVRDAHFDSSGNWQSGDGLGIAGSNSLIIQGTAPCYPQVTLHGPHTGAFSFGVNLMRQWKPWYAAGDLIQMSCGNLPLGSGDVFVIDTDPANRHYAFLLNDDPRAGYILWGAAIGGSNTYNEDTYFPYFYPSTVFSGIVNDYDSMPLQVVLGNPPASGADIRWQEAFLA
jgi:hypothetical protein